MAAREVDGPSKMATIHCPCGEIYDHEVTGSEFPEEYTWLLNWTCVPCETVYEAGLNWTTGKFVFLRSYPDLFAPIGGTE